MLRIILFRSLQGIVVLLIVSAVTFVLLAATGGDALTALLADPLVSEETINNLRRVYGLDQPLAVRYFRWLTGALNANLGRSFFYGAPVWQIIRPRLVNTLALAMLSLFIAWGVAFTLGILATRRRAGRWLNRFCDVVILLAASTPRIVLALAVLVVAARTSFFTLGATVGSSGNALDYFARILPPALVLSVPLIALFLAQTRESVESALREDFVQAARAKGLPERLVFRRHALRAALNPLITIFGFSLGATISGSVVVETVLGWPGLGQLSVIAVRSRDVPLLMGVVLVTATGVLIGNLIADILLRINDPRLRPQ